MGKIKDKIKGQELIIELVKEQFDEIFLKYTDQKTVDKLFSDVVRCYSARGRHYHDMGHIYYMCSKLEMIKYLKVKLNNPIALFIAIIYHDIIYNPLKKDNEEKSAQYFNDNVAIPLKLDLALVVKINCAIRATKHDEESKKIYENDTDIKYLLDIDLSILGNPYQSRYEWYRKGVRKEYKIYPKVLYNPGRKKVLEGFLNRERIYLTKIFFDACEKKARKNLQNEINLYLC